MAVAHLQIRGDCFEEGEIHAATQVGIGSRSATQPVIRPGTFLHSAAPVARERNPTGHTRGNVFQTRNAGHAGAQRYRVTRVGTCSGRATPVAQERNPTVTVIRAGTFFQTRNAGRAGAQPYRSHARERFSRRATPVARETQPYRSYARERFFRRATPVAQERNPSGHTRGNVFQTRNAGRASYRSYARHGFRGRISIIN